MAGDGGSARPGSGGPAARVRRRGLAFTVTSIGLAVVLVVVLALVSAYERKHGGADLDAPASAVLVQDLATIPAAAFAAAPASTVGPDGALKAVGGTAVTTDGKPTVVYVGGEFCPYCAAERWAVVAALDRFGSFTGLQTTRSASGDGDVATLTFLTATYSSRWVALDATEYFDRAEKRLQTPSAAAMASWKQYGKPPGVPYLSIDDRFVAPGAQYAYRDLGKASADDLAAQIAAGRTKVAQEVLASANILTAGICATTGQQPAAVCTAPEVVAAASSLGS